jgi:branched-chain amino acid aminotransferase
VADEILVWRQGQLIPSADATVHVLTHALHYGSGVFEGIRAYEAGQGTAVFRLTDHMRRLVRSAEAVRIPLEWSAEQLSAAAKETLAANHMASGYVRPITFYETGGMGVLPKNVPVVTMIAVWHWGAYLGEDGIRNGIRTVVSPWRRFSRAVLPLAKTTGGYINAMLAKIDAVRAGYDEAIMLSTEGEVCEGSGENIFLVEKGVVYTPPLSAGCLDGITRNTIMTLLREDGYQVVEESLPQDRLFTADEVMLTGTAAEVTPVREIDDRPVGEGKPGPITRHAQTRFADLVRGRSSGHADWLEYL